MAAGMPKKPSTSTLCRPLSTAATATQPLPSSRRTQGICLPPSAPPSCCNRCPVEALQRHPLAILVLMRRMFTWQQIPKMMELKALLEAAVAQHPEWPAAERGNLLGECDLIQSFLFYNDITQMSRLHRSASRQMSRPAVTLRNSGSWTFGSPSVLMMYYRAPGELGKELAEMYECMPHYYKITNGHGRGAELLMDAEAAYLQGAWEKAAVLLERARADAAGQENMTLCCNFLVLRLALCGKGKEGYDFAAKRAALLQKHDGVQVHLLESIAAYFYALQGRPEQAPELFREHKLAEVSFFGPCRPMMSLIEQQVWLAQGSTLSYGKTFSPHDRTVKLDGEAFFDVASDRDHPFFVKTNTVVVKVVGTSFNVKMYKDTDDTEVVLERGVVKLQFGDNDNMITMQPGQKIYYSSASHDISISEVNVEYLMLLKYGMISMSDVRVAEIIRKVEEIYSVDIETVAPLDDDRLYNFNFLKSNTLDDVLDIIEKMSGVKCRPAPAAGAE